MGHDGVKNSIEALVESYYLAKDNNRREISNKLFKAISSFKDVDLDSINDPVLNGLILKAFISQGRSGSAISSDKEIDPDLLLESFQIAIDRNAMGSYGPLFKRIGSQLGNFKPESLRNLQAIFLSGFLKQDNDLLNLIKDRQDKNKFIQEELLIKVHEQLSGNNRNISKGLEASFKFLPKIDTNPRVKTHKKSRSRFDSFKDLFNRRNKPNDLESKTDNNIKPKIGSQSLEIFKNILSNPSSKEELVGLFFKYYDVKASIDNSDDFFRGILEFSIKNRNPKIISILVKNGCISQDSIIASLDRLISQEYGNDLIKSLIDALDSTQYIDHLASKLITLAEKGNTDVINKVVDKLKILTSQIEGKQQSQDQSSMLGTYLGSAFERAYNAGYRNTAIELLNSDVAVINLDGGAVKDKKQSKQDYLTQGMQDRGDISMLQLLSQKIKPSKTSRLSDLVQRLRSSSKVQVNQEEKALKSDLDQCQTNDFITVGSKAEKILLGATNDSKSLEFVVDNYLDKYSQELVMGSIISMMAELDKEENVRILKKMVGKVKFSEENLSVLNEYFAKFQNVDLVSYILKNQEVEFSAQNVTSLLHSLAFSNGLEERQMLESFINERGDAMTQSQKNSTLVFARNQEVFDLLVDKFDIDQNVVNMVGYNLFNIEARSDIEAKTADTDVTINTDVPSSTPIPDAKKLKGDKTVSSNELG